MLVRRGFQRGDTLIEVLFAITVFSALAVGALAIMNQGAAVAQRSMEISLVRQQIDAQAQALSFINAAYIAQYPSPDPNETYTQRWRSIADTSQQAVSQATVYGTLDADRCLPSSSIPKNFIVDPLTAQIQTSGVQPADTFAQVRYNDAGDFVENQGIWIEAVSEPSSGSTPGYVDFHIRACWDSPGQAVPVTLGTIVRLYDPAL